MSDVKIHWVDSSCPFDDSEIGLSYAKTVDLLVDDLVDSLFAEEDLSFDFETFELNDEDICYFVIYDASGDEVISGRNGVNLIPFKHSIIDKYASVYSLTREIFKYRPYLSESFPGLTRQPLDKGHPDYEIHRAFFGALDEGRIFDKVIIRYVFQKIMYQVVDRYENYTIVSP